MTLAVGLALSAVLAVAVGTAVVEAQTSEGPFATPNLGLEPSSGPPGTSVTAVVTGFDACEVPGDTGGDTSGVTADVARPGEVVITWQGQPVASADLVDGSARPSFPIPASAASGPQDVVASCDPAEAINATARFVVEPPVELRRVVPDVVGATLEEATAAIVGADLDVGEVIGDGALVQAQDPPAETEVEPGTAVDLDLGVVPPEVDVEVPDLTGVDLDDVPAVLAARGLVLGVVRGEGDVVRGQDPLPGSRVPSGSAIDVSSQPELPPEVLVAVPDVGGVTADEARAAVEAVGLVLGGGLEGDERVAAQHPAADTLVAPGSVVTVSAEVATTPAVTPARPVSWLGVLATLVGLLIAAWLVGRMLRSRRDRRWIRRHVSVERGPTASSRPVVHEDDGGRPTSVVRLEPHLDAGPPTLEEVAP